MSHVCFFISEIYGFRRKSAADVKCHGKRQNSRFSWILWIFDFRTALYFFTTSSL